MLSNTHTLTNITCMHVLVHMHTFQPTHLPTITGQWQLPPVCKGGHSHSNPPVDPCPHPVLSDSHPSPRLPSTPSSVSRASLSFLFCFVPLPASLLCPLEDSQRLQSATKEDSKDRAQWTPGSSHASACTSVWGKGSGYFIYLFIYPSCPAPHPASCRSPLGKMKNSLRQQQTRQTTWPPQFNFL